jgi:ATP-dependent DNA ligase
MPGFPDWVEPMAATLTQERFSGPDWVFERKLDGIRLLAYKRGTDVSVFSRNRLIQNHSYPEVVRAVAELPVKDAILDGEATGVWGKPGRLAYHVFDVLWLDGRDTHCPAARGAPRRCCARCPCGRPCNAYCPSKATSPGSAPAARAGRA